jgi:asparagine N-glycosylation enzyme membrane subunit Stt3
MFIGVRNGGEGYYIVFVADSFAIAQRLQLKESAIRYLSNRFTYKYTYLWCDDYIKSVEILEVKPNQLLDLMR